MQFEGVAGAIDTHRVGLLAVRRRPAGDAAGVDQAIAVAGDPHADAARARRAGRGQHARAARRALAALYPAAVVQRAHVAGQCQARAARAALAAVEFAAGLAPAPVAALDQARGFHLPPRRRQGQAGPAGAARARPVGNRPRGAAIAAAQGAVRGHVQAQIVRRARQAMPAVAAAAAAPRTGAAVSALAARGLRREQLDPYIRRIDAYAVAAAPAATRLEPRAARPSTPAHDGHGQRTITAAGKHGRAASAATAATARLRAGAHGAAVVARAAATGLEIRAGAERLGHAAAVAARRPHRIDDGYTAASSTVAAAAAPAVMNHPLPPLAAPARRRRRRYRRAWASSCRRPGPARVRCPAVPPAPGRWRPRRRTARRRPRPAARHARQRYRPARRPAAVRRARPARATIQMGVRFGKSVS